MKINYLNFDKRNKDIEILELNIIEDDILKVNEYLETFIYEVDISVEDFFNL
jgi:hypothetical protein